MFVISKVVIVVVHGSISGAWLILLSNEVSLVTLINKPQLIWPVTGSRILLWFITTLFV